MNYAKTPFLQRRSRFIGRGFKLEEMLGNLLDNACKWANGRVVVAARPAGERESGRMLILVADDGPGVDGEDQRREMLKRGRRLDETKPGSGLGLSIVAAIFCNLVLTLNHKPGRYQVA